MSKDLKTLYSVFDLLNGEDISHSPSMSNPQTFHMDGTLQYLQEVMDNKRELTLGGLGNIKSLLIAVNQCYYQPSEIREPVRINNCPYIKICDKLLEEL